MAAVSVRRRVVPLAAAVNDVPDDDQVNGWREPDPARLYEQVADVTLDVEPFHDLDDPERAMARHILRLLARADQRPTAPPAG